ADEKLLSIDEVFKEENGEADYLEETVKRQICVLKRILQAGYELRSDPKWMYKQIIEYGLNCFQAEWYTFDPSIRWDIYGLLQIPEEFADFCASLSRFKFDTAIEIGVYRGRSSYFMCAVMAATNPDIKYTMVDIYDQLDHFEEYKKLLPQLQKAVPDTSDDFSGQGFDFVFIDADHSYDGSIRDFDNVGRWSKHMTAFHDIYAHEYDGENGGTVRMWKEVCERTQGKMHRIFSKYPDKWMGIGCVYDPDQE
nr:class I SAM-dependent methyltransferase [Lachnospiraceae bacterium]